MRSLPNVLAITIDFDGNLWRAVFVAALALIVFTLATYYSNLRLYRRRVRLVLVSLRGLSLLLIACALAGLHVAYNITAPSSVLLYRYEKRASDDAVLKGEADNSLEANVNDAALRETINALAESGVESVVVDGINGAAKIKRLDDFSAALLVTDGAMASEEARRVIYEMSKAAKGAPVYVAGNFDAGNTNQARVALQKAAPVGGSSVWRGVPVAVRCLMHGRGMNGRESLLTITDDTQAVRASTKVRWTTNDEWQTVVLQVVPKTAGWTNFTAHVEAAGGEAAATLVRSFSLYAEEHRVRVLFFEGEPTWEAKFIRRALTESGLFDMDYFAQVSRVAAVGIAKNRKSNDAAASNGNAAQTNGMNEEQRAAEEDDAANNAASGSASVKDAPEVKLHEALSSAARLNAYDCVIVGATPNALLSVAEAERLRTWVEQRGGGLIVLGGNSFAGAIAAPNGKLYAMLPAAIDSRQLTSELQQRAQGVPLEASEDRGSVALTPTETGAFSALAAYRDAREADDAVRGKAAAKRVLLSGEGFRLSALRAGAFALATNGMADANGTSDTGSMLIAAMRDGAGNTLLFAPADSWRIRTAASGAQNESGDAFAALWQGILLWSAKGARASVELVLSDDSPGAGDEVVAELRVRDTMFSPLKIARVNAHLQRIIESDEGDSSNATTEPIEIAFAPDNEDASLWRAHFKMPARGHFVLEADYVAGGKSGKASKLFTLIAPTALEAGAAGDALRRLARETGGAVFDNTQAHALAAHIAALPRRSEKVERIKELRTWWLLVIIISLFLAAEWFARRFWQVD